MKFGRNVGPRKEEPEFRRDPEGSSGSILQPQARHLLGYAAKNEGHVNSATRRTKDFMGIFRSTPPCDGNVLGHQAGYFRDKGQGVGG